MNIPFPIDVSYIYIYNIKGIIEDIYHTSIPPWISWDADLRSLQYLEDPWRSIHEELILDQFYIAIYPLYNIMDQYEMNNMIWRDVASKDFGDWRESDGISTNHQSIVKIHIQDMSWEDPMWANVVLFWGSVRHRDSSTARPCLPEGKSTTIPYPMILHLFNHRKDCKTILNYH